MPELPEVETVRRGLARELVGRRLAEVQFFRPDLRWPMPVAAITALRGRRCRRVARRGKYVTLELGGDDRPTLLVHLGMSGRLLVAAGRRRPPLLPHEHWRMRFGDRLLRFVDPRRFGVLDLIAAGDDAARHPLLCHLGPEPLSPAFDGEALFAATRRRRTAIKALLMDSRVVVGVGNIYACEALFRAGIRPRRAAGRLTRAECARLADAVRATLRDAIRAGGTSLRDYVSADGEPGWFQVELRVYGRQGEACTRCRSPIVRHVDAGRSTFSCRRCQR